MHTACVLTVTQIVSRASSVKSMAGNPPRLRMIQTSRMSLAGGQPEPPTITVSTFNIWCPLFRSEAFRQFASLLLLRLIAVPRRRMHDSAESRECHFKEQYMERNRKIIELLDKLDSDVICLQEFWVSNHELVDLYKSHFCRRSAPLPETSARILAAHT